MGSTQDKNRARMLTLATRFESLVSSDSAAKLTRILERIEKAINDDRFIEAMPAPTGLAATSVANGVLLTWDGLELKYKTSAEGARIWRCDYSVNTNLSFNDNNDKIILVPLIRSTGYVDSGLYSSDKYTYWVEWLNLDGKASPVSDPVVGEAGEMATASPNSVWGRVVIDRMGIRVYDPVGALQFDQKTAMDSPLGVRGLYHVRASHTFSTTYPFLIDGFGDISIADDYYNGDVKIYLDHFNKWIDFYAGGYVAAYKVFNISSSGVSTPKLITANTMSATNINYITTFTHNNGPILSSVGPHSITLSKITPGGTDGSISFNTYGIVTTYTDPT